MVCSLPPSSNPLTSPSSSSSSLCCVCLCYPTALSHQPADHSRVQPLRRHHGQLPVQLEDVSAGHRGPAGRGAAAGEQSAAVLGPLWPHPPPCLHRLRRRLSPEGEFGALGMSTYMWYFVPSGCAHLQAAAMQLKSVDCFSQLLCKIVAKLIELMLSNFSTLVSFKLLFLLLCVRCEPLLLPPFRRVTFFRYAFRKGGKKLH